MSEIEPVAIVSQRFDEPLDPRVGMQGLRDGFASLMDRMVSELQSLRLDFDDCVLDRYATIGCGGERPVEAPVMFLSDADSFLKSLRGTGLHDSDGDSGVASVRVYAISVRALRTPDYPSKGPSSLLE